MEKVAKRIALPKKIHFSSIVIIALVALLSFICFIEIPTIITASSASNLLGETTGKMVGLAVGSAKALADASERIGNKIDDETNNPTVTIDIKSDIQSIGFLEVLSADIKISDIYTVGGKDKNGDGKIDDFTDTSYAALYVWDTKGVFTVDLSKINPSISGKNISITLDSPKLSLQFSEEGKEQLFEYSGFSIIPADKAYNGFLNSQKEAITKARENIADYPALLEQAKESAEKTIKSLFKAMRGDSYNINITWKGEGKVENGRN